MIMISPPSGQAYVYFILFSTFALQVAALQNITVDDSVLTGAVVPTYLPSLSNWNQGNLCTVCFVKPDPSQAYNGTWHDTTFLPNSTVFQEFEFTFTGNGLYIYFILANYVPYANTNTSVNFYLDGVLVSSFSHAPSTSSAYEYNQAVFANDSIPQGQHTMLVTPVNDSVPVDNILILFDYLVYTTTDGTTTTLTALTQVATPIQSPSSSSTGVQAASSGPSVGAIVGGVLAGVGTLALGVSLLWYRRYKRLRGAQPSTVEVIQVVEPFFSPSTPPEATPLRNEPVPIGSPHTNSRATGKSITPSAAATVPPSNSVSNVTHGAASSNTAEILEQVVLLRDEVARLHRLQDQNLTAAELGSEPPPEYSGL